MVACGLTVAMDSALRIFIARTEACRSTHLSGNTKEMVLGSARWKVAIDLAWVETVAIARCICDDYSDVDLQVHMSASERHSGLRSGAIQTIRATRSCYTSMA
jgi:hypothetical protein